MITDEDSGNTFEIMGPLVRSSAHTAGSKKKRIQKRIQNKIQKKSHTKKNKKHVRK